MNRDKITGSIVTILGTAAILGAGYLFAAQSSGRVDDKGEGTRRTAMSAEQVMERVRQRTEGEIAELEREDGGYEVKVIDKDGRKREYYVDESGELRDGEDSD
ncbi:MAG: PepSY domain-containing protein [Ectothiorhodospiraceae bacterium]|jgi:uncharacterized membrane protein YkoI